MKLIVIIIMLIALYLLYRIAFPKQTATKKEVFVPDKGTKTTRSVMGKSRFVLSDRSQPAQTPATTLKTENQAEKPSTFALETEEKRSGVIPPDKVDEVFVQEPNPEDLDIEPDEDEEIDFAAETEAEEINRVLGHEAMIATGVDYNDLKQVVRVVKEQPETVSEETGNVMVELEHTDLFEMLASGDEGKMNWIKSVINRNVQNRIPETDNESDTDYGNFNIADILIKPIKRKTR